ncbi:MAG: transcription antitermination factor NusB [Candidatus Eremiobacteraeota bacterium]|nr:transcription antitermination factor NusB [Candidatus Eremiobacteraeota bacterium]
MPSRRMARELALQALFSIEVGHREAADVLDEYLASHAENADRLFVKNLVLGTMEHAAASEAIFAPLLQGWTIDRLPTIDRLLLRMATYELQYHPQTPRAVVINEAIELAKKFSTEDSGRFVNGVLSAIGAHHAST